MGSHSRTRLSTPACKSVNVGCVFYRNSKERNCNQHKQTLCAESPSALRSPPPSLSLPGARNSPGICQTCRLWLQEAQGPPRQKRSLTLATDLRRDSKLSAPLQHHSFPDSPLQGLTGSSAASSSPEDSTQPLLERGRNGPSFTMKQKLFKVDAPQVDYTERSPSEL